MKSAARTASRSCDERAPRHCKKSRDVIIVSSKCPSSAFFALLFAHVLDLQPEALRPDASTLPAHRYINILKCTRPSLDTLPSPFMNCPSFPPPCDPRLLAASPALAPLLCFAHAKSLWYVSPLLCRRVCTPVSDTRYSLTGLCPFQQLDECLVITRLIMLVGQF